MKTAFLIRNEAEIVEEKAIMKKMTARDCIRIEIRLAFIRAARRLVDFGKHYKEYRNGIVRKKKRRPLEYL